MTARKEAIPSFRGHFTPDDIVEMHNILKGGRPRKSAAMREHFIERADFIVASFVAHERDNRRRMNAEARRNRLKRMQRAIAALISEWQAADESEQYVISNAIRRHFPGAPYAQFFFHGNLEVYASALKTAEGWTREVKPTFGSELLVSDIAAAWREAFDVDPKTTIRGPFEKMALIVVKAATGKSLHRRNFLRGIGHHHWLQMIVAENESNRNQAVVPMKPAGD